MELPGCSSSPSGTKRLRTVAVRVVATVRIGVSLYSTPRLRRPMEPRVGRVFNSCTSCFSKLKTGISERTGATGTGGNGVTGATGGKRGLGNGREKGDGGNRGWDRTEADLVLPALSPIPRPRSPGPSDIPV